MKKFFDVWLKVVIIMAAFAATVMIILGVILLCVGHPVIGVAVAIFLFSLIIPVIVSIIDLEERRNAGWDD